MWGYTQIQQASPTEKLRQKKPLQSPKMKSEKSKKSTRYLGPPSWKSKQPGKPKQLQTNERGYCADSGLRSLSDYMNTSCSNSQIPHLSIARSLLLMLVTPFQVAYNRTFPLGYQDETGFHYGVDKLPPQTIQRTIFFRNTYTGGDGWIFYPLKVLIGARCPRCGGPRGEAKPGRVFEDGDVFYVDSWENPCGHVDNYADCYREARRLGTVQSMEGDLIHA